jgi:hypothetical protein
MWPSIRIVISSLVGIGDLSVCLSEEIRPLCSWVPELITIYS